jgi:UDP-N-acetylglucosamine acyltransferase
MPTVHPSAIIGKHVQLAENVSIGPHCVLEGNVRLGAGVTLLNGVTIQGPVEIGEGTMLYPGTCIGFPPQDVKFKIGMDTPGVRIGKNCLIREHVTIHAASTMDHPTTVGDNCFLMVNSHLGHDVVIGDNVTLVNAVLLAGHVSVGNNVTMGGCAAVHQFCRIGRLAMVSGLVAVAMDIPPFCISGARNTVAGLNAVGLRRNGVPREDITLLRKAFRVGLGVRQPREAMLAAVEPLAKGSALVKEFYEFLAAPTKRGIAPARMAEGEEEEGTEARRHEGTK